MKTTGSNHGRPVAANQLLASAPPGKLDEVWVSDITCIATEEGWLYLVAVKDLFSRRVPGWSMSERTDTALVLRAMNHAIVTRGGKPARLFHSDQGVQHASEAFCRKLADWDIEPSMSGRGNCYDNACMESGRGTLKAECVYRQHFETRAQARGAIFEHLDFYNQRRLHSALGCKSLRTLKTKTTSHQNQPPFSPPLFRGKLKKAGYAST